MIINFKPATAAFTRALAHSARMQAKRDRSPSRALVAQALAAWRTSRGYPATANVNPEGWPSDFTAQVAWARASLA
jgi:hypothetical protein